MTTEPALPAALGSLSILATLLLSTTVRAADPPNAGSRSFQGGSCTLVTQGDYPAACAKFEQSLALEAGLGTGVQSG